MEIRKVFEDVRNRLYSNSDFIPLRELLIFGEFTLIFILFSSLLFQEHLPSIAFWPIIIFLSLLFILSFILLFARHELTFIAFIGGMFILAGSSVISLLLELSFSRLKIYPLEILFMVNAIFIVFIGIKLLNFQYKKIEKKSLLFLSWSFSILFIAYVLVSELNMTLDSFGYGLVTSLIFGGFLSFVSSILYLNRLHDEEIQRDKINNDMSKFFEDLEDSEEYYENINKLRRT